MADLSYKLQDAFFYAIVDTGYVSYDDIYSKCEQLIKSGSKIIQLRAKNEDEDKKRELAFELLPLFKKDNAPFFIINDSVELASEICSIIPNAGLHVGQDDISAIQARKAIGQNRILGLSTHSVEQATNANKLENILDYFAVGPVYATNTKPGRTPVGLELVSNVAKMEPKLPWFAIGGVNLKTANAVRLAGASRIVAVSDVLLPENTAQAVKKLEEAFYGKNA